MCACVRVCVKMTCRKTDGDTPWARDVPCAVVRMRTAATSSACVAVRCSVLQCVAVCYIAATSSAYVAVHCSALQCVAVRCSAMQCVAVRCSALQCVTVRCSV